MTKGRLREILADEGRMRILVGQLSTVGREVRSTTMQWAYESKKLDCTVKHLSWVPPWVRVKDPKKKNPAGERFVKSEHMCDDTVGLGRHPSMWWTMNCKYNAAYDVQRLNTKSEMGNASVCADVAGNRQERFEFGRDNPDLVAYTLALRTELLMRIVMPAVVDHSDAEPYMTMARFETGPGGNPHFHGFSIGRRCPQFRHVKDDDGFDGDMPPETVNEDFRLWQRVLENDKPDFWPFGVEKTKIELDVLLCDILSGRWRREGAVNGHEQADGAVSERGRILAGLCT